MPARRGTPAKKNRDWFDYIGPIITSIVGAAVILFVSKSCANSDATHAVVTDLTKTTVPILSKDVEATKAAVAGVQTVVTNVQSDVAKVRADVADAKGQMVTKGELDAKNQGLQQQFQRVYDNQSKMSEKVQQFQIDVLKNNKKTKDPDE